MALKTHSIRSKSFPLQEKYRELLIWFRSRVTFCKVGTVGTSLYGGQG